MPLTKHEARKILIVARKVRDAVDEAMEVLTSEERQHAESSWAGMLRGMVNERPMEGAPWSMPVVEAELLLDSGAGN